MLYFSYPCSPTSYTVKRSTTSGGAPTGTTVYTGSALTYTNTSLAASTTYYYVVSATNAYGTSAYSSQASTTTSASGSTAFVTSFTPGASRNDYTRVGMKITVGSSNIVVTAVGRIFKSGNTGTHTVHIETLSGSDVMAGVAINVSSGTAGQITYVNLGTPVTLLANTSYYIGSDETVGGDSWYDSTTSIAHTSVVSATVPFYRDSGGAYQVLAGPDKSCGPVSFKHQ